MDFTLIGWVLYAACLFVASCAGNMIANRMREKRDEKRYIRAMELENKFRNDPCQREFEEKLKAEFKNALNLIRKLDEQIDKANEKINKAQ